MATFTFKNLTVTAAEITTDVKRNLVRAWLQGQRFDGVNLPVIEDTEIDALLADHDAEQVERLDLADLGQMVAAELAYLNTTITGWAALTPEQKDAAQKRGLQEIRAILKALLFVVRQAR